METTTNNQTNEQQEIERLRKENEALKRKQQEDKDTAELEGLMLGALYGRTMGRSLRMAGVTDIISEGGYDV